MYKTGSTNYQVGTMAAIPQPVKTGGVLAAANRIRPAAASAVARQPRRRSLPSVTVRAPAAAAGGRRARHCSGRRAGVIPAATDVANGRPGRLRTAPGWPQCRHTGRQQGSKSRNSAGPLRCGARCRRWA